MKIHFDHNGQDFVAELHFNFKEVEDCALVVFEDAFDQDILFSKVMGVWTSVSDLQDRYPQTYLNIQKAILLTFDAGTN